MRKRYVNTVAIPAQRGFTLVELMIALLISLILMGGVVQVFSSSTKTYRAHEGLSRIQENGRFALEFLKRDIRMADFWGCTNRVNKITNNLDPANGGTNWQFDFNNGGLAGTDGGGNNPDSIVLRGAFDVGLYVQPPYGPQASSNIKVPPNSILAQGDIVMISDCESADIIQITNQITGTNVSLVHNTGSTEIPGNYNATNPGCPGGGNAHCLSKVYEGDAQVFQARTIAYSIAAGASGQPALFRNDGATNLELVDGVVNMQILYGEDNDAPGSVGFGTADYYVPAGSVTDMENVVSVKLSLLLQSYEDNLAHTPMTYTYNGSNTTAADRRLYQVFGSTVAVRNRIQ
jgi:type IV pilus assembly protein PilW